MLAVERVKAPENVLVGFEETYPTKAVAFLHFDPTTRSFLFEERINEEDPLCGQTVIPGGKIEDKGELGFPLWAVRREQLEECGIIPSAVVYLGNFGEPGRVRMSCFLTVGTLYGEFFNKESDKSNWKWLTEDEVYEGNGGIKINPRFELKTTQRILRKAREEMVRLGI